MRTGISRGLGVIAALLLCTAEALAQDAAAPRPLPPPPPLPVSILDAASLERLAKALATPPMLVLRPNQSRFYSLTTLKLSSIAEDMKKWDVAVTPISAPGPPGAVRAGTAADLGQLIGLLFHTDPNAQVRQLRDRIDRELSALTAKKK